MNLLTQSPKNNNPVTFHRTDAGLLWAIAANLALGLTLNALLPLTPRASADSFFSTGDPDGKIGTLSRPASAGLVQTETADDFILTESMVINQATFTGLLPSMTPLTSIEYVEIEIYPVFPDYSNTDRTINVPTRMNSPADVGIGSATRDSSAGNLSYTATVLNPVFSILNSVVNEIHLSPLQGEGPVTGQEVSITVTFDPPIALPADHYFFRPEVELSSGNFLWLSAPKPVVTPGTPFAPDLQSWIRNDTIGSDWLRIGTDITLQGPFNASFSLSGESKKEQKLVKKLEDIAQGTLKTKEDFRKSFVDGLARQLANEIRKQEEQRLRRIKEIARDKGY